MAFDLNKLMRNDGLKPEYVCTKYMANVDDLTVEKLDTKPKAKKVHKKMIDLEAANRKNKELEAAAKKKKEEGTGPTDEEKKRMAGKLKSGYRPEGE